MDDIHLDHLAIAAERITDLWPRYAGDLAAGWVGMRPDVGFTFCHLRFGNGRRIEMLEPYDDGRDDFLHRFIAANGAGPHHMTFKVPDLKGMLAGLADAGFSPVRVSYDDPEWWEAFLHPKEATGVVVQLAQVTRGAPETPMPDDVSLPQPRVAHAAHLDWVAHAVASLDDGMRLFAEILGGAEQGRGVDGDIEWVDLEWPEEGRIRLLHAVRGRGPLADWLGAKSGRIHHLAFSVEDPAGIADANRQTDGCWEIAPEANHGVRLRLSPRPA